MKYGLMAQMVKDQMEKDRNMTGKVSIMLLTVFNQKQLRLLWGMIFVG